MQRVRQHSVPRCLLLFFVLGSMSRPTAERVDDAGERCSNAMPQKRVGLTRRLTHPFGRIGQSLHLRLRELLWL